MEAAGGEFGCRRILSADPDGGINQTLNMTVISCMIAIFPHVLLDFFTLFCVFFLVFRFAKGKIISPMILIDEYSLLVKKY